MKRNRSRYRKRSASGAATLFLLVLLVAAIIWFAVTHWTGGWLSNLFSGATAAPTAEVTAEPTLSAETPAPSSVPADRVTETVRTEGFALYAVQLGAFAQRDNAEALLASLALKGLHGCILDDGERCRVFTDIKADREDAILARDAVVSRYSLEALVYELAVPGVSLKVVADQSQLTAMTDSYTQWYEAVKGLTALIGPFESGQLTGEACRVQLSTYAQRLDAASQQLRNAAGDTTGATVLEQWLAVLDDTEEGFRALALQAGDTADRDGGLAAALRQALVDGVARYNVFAAGNPSGRPY